MSANKVLPVFISVIVIIAIAVIQERSKALAAIIATMPMTAPLAMWIVYSASHGDQQKTIEFTASMISGILATLIFVATCWLGLRLKLSFGMAMLAGWVTWAVVAFGVPAVLRLTR